MSSNFRASNWKRSRFSAHIALGLNVTQNHLDRHHTFESYAEAKGRLFECSARKITLS